MNISNIRQYINNLSNSAYLTNLRVLMTGASISQIILLCVSPFLTRLYSPVDFGYYEVFSSIVAIVVAFALFQYDLTIYLYEKEEECINALISCVLVLLLTCTVVSVALIGVKPLVIKLTKVKIESGWEYLIPTYVFFSCCYNILIGWYTKFGVFKIIARSRIYISIFVASLQIFFGYIKLGHFGLILSTTIVQFVTFFILFIPFYSKYKHTFSHIDFKKVKKNIIDNKRYPLLVFPGNFINNFAQNIPSFFLVKLDPTIAGYYSLSRRIIGFPLAFISNSVQSIFMKEASDEFNKTGMTASSFRKNLKIFFAIAVILFLLILTLSDFFVPLIFGSFWIKSVIYIKILSVLYLVRFVSGGLSFVMIFGKGPKLDIFWQLGFLSISYLSFYISTSLDFTSFNTILTYCLGLTTFYFLYMYQSYRISINNYNNI